MNFKLKYWILVVLVVFNLRLAAQETKIPVLVVANKSGDNISIIDYSNGNTLAILPTGIEPHEVEVSDNGRWAVVSNYGKRDKPGNTLSVYDLHSRSLYKTIDLGKHSSPHGMQWVKGTNSLFVTAEGSNHLLLVDIQNEAITLEMPTGEEVSHMVAVSPDLSKAFVPSIRTGNVAVFDLSTGSLLKHIYSGKGAEGIAVSPDGKEVWVTNRADNTITVFDSDRLEMIASIACADFPIRAKFTPDGRYFAVSNARSGDIAIFDANEKTLKTTVKLMPPPPSENDGNRYFAEFLETSVPIGIVIPDHQTLVVANTRSDVVTLINLESFQIQTHFVAGKEPDGVGFGYTIVRADENIGITPDRNNK